MHEAEVSLLAPYKIDTAYHNAGHPEVHEEAGRAAQGKVDALGILTASTKRCKEAMGIRPFSMCSGVIFPWVPIL